MRRLIHDLTTLTLGAALAAGVVIVTQGNATAETPPAPEWQSLPACANEDGPGPCLWDAQSEGNEVGQSFYIGTDHCTYRFGPHGTYRDPEFPCTDPYA